MRVKPKPRVDHTVSWLAAAGCCGCLNPASLSGSISSNRSSLKSRGCVQSFKRPRGLHPPPIAQVDTRKRLSYLREHRRHRPKTTNSCSLVENVGATFLHNVWALAAMICGPLGNRSKHRRRSQQPGFPGSSLRAMRCSCTCFYSPAAVPCRHFERQPKPLQCKSSCQK